MQSEIWMEISVFICFFLLSSGLTLTLAEEKDLRSKVISVYAELAEAEANGADVTVAASKLNEALRLISQAEEAKDPERILLLSKASILIDEAEKMIPELIEAGRTAALYRNFLTGISVAFLAISAFILYFYGPKALWRLWLKSRREWRVRKT